MRNDGGPHRSASSEATFSETSQVLAVAFLQPSIFLTLCPVISPHPLERPFPSSASFSLALLLSRVGVHKIRSKCA